MRNRSRSEILYHILLAAANNRQRITRSRIMYGALLSSQQLKEYLKLVLDSGLLRYDRATDTYRITAKGTEVLTMYNRLGEFAPANSQIVARRPGNAPLLGRSTAITKLPFM
jgi:predicted transcriptional regulator